MTTLIGLHSLYKSYGTQLLFDNLSLTLTQGERIGLIGPNGSGKSTLLKIIANIEAPDGGHLSMRQGIRIAYACQEPQFEAQTLDEIMLNTPGAPGDRTTLETRAAILLSKGQFEDPTRLANSLSGGEKKRLDIVRALMLEPDFLLLDEPTNHLDLAGLIWLEKLLNREKLSYIAVSHDRYFLENVCSKIIELNRCYPEGLFICDGPMSSFMERKAQFIANQNQQQKTLSAAVRQEVEWLRKSPQARTTKSRSRIAKAYALIDEYNEVKQRNSKSRVDIDFEASERGTHKLLSTKNIAKSQGGKTLFEEVTLTLAPKSRLGIVGNNGTGKTTLLKVLAQIIPADKGTIKYAEDLKLVYFDQHREQLPPHLTLRQALSLHSDFVCYRGQEIHVNGWAKKFLFSPDRLELNVGSLSGGERARLLIAKLMLQPADILFLDEPTNDLDIDTLEIIEDSLSDFSGAVVLISHDRCFMERLCTQYLTLGPDLKPHLFADYSQCEAAICMANKATTVKPPLTTNSASATSVNTGGNAIGKKKLTYMEQKELAGMEEAIANIETEIINLQHKLSDPDIACDSAKSLELYSLLAEKQHALEERFTRWEFLSQYI